MKLKATISLGLVLALLTAAFAQEPTAPTLPATPAARLIEAYLKAFNSGKVAAVQEFHAKHDARPVHDDFNDAETREKLQTLFARFGALKVQRILESNPLDLQVLLKTSKGMWLSLWFQVQENAPDKLAGLRLEPAPAPPTPKEERQ